MNKRCQLKKSITQAIDFKYLLYLPPGYRANSRQRWPLLLFLHGSEERGRNLAQVSVNGPPLLVKQKQQFPFMIVSPQCPKRRRWDNEMLLALLDEVVAEQRVDTRRVYVTGISMGGYAVWSLAARHPERFAAVAPICGGGEVVDVMCATGRKEEAIRSLGVWAFHGANDPFVPVAESQRMVEAFRQAGCRDANLLVYPHAGHDAWTETYNNPKFYEWLLSCARK